MNPYDFVPIDWSKVPVRRGPVWHHLVADAQRSLYSGFIEVDIEAETPLFILDPRSPHPRDGIATHIVNEQGDYIIPGSSLKGMLRCLVETLGNGCLTLFDGAYEPIRERGRRGEFLTDYKELVPPEFRRCTDNTNLCVACRTFGMMQAEERRADVFLGKVNIGDAVVYRNRLYMYDPIYTGVLDTPKPHHRAFYLDPTGRRIAGRKYYFHRDPSKHPITEDRLIPIRNSPGEYRNKDIHPLGYGTAFHVRIDFTALEADEFATLMAAIMLEEKIRHKIGYGKPLGLGSIQLKLTCLKLVDYASRYTLPRSKESTQIWEDERLLDLLNEQMSSLGNQQIVGVLQHIYSPQHEAMKHLRRIWQWPPAPGMTYVYPSQQWFKNHPTARISETLHVDKDTF